MTKTEFATLTAALDFAVTTAQGVRLRDGHLQIKAGVALLDRHQLWKPVGAVRKRASAAIVLVLTQHIYNQFGDPLSQTAWFRKADRQVGALCARVVVAFGLQRHRKAKAFWTYSRFGLGTAIE